MTYEDRDRVIAWFDAGGGAELAPTKRIMFAELAAHVNGKSGQAYPGPGYLGQRWGVSAGRVSNIETELIELGYIRRSRLGHYVILWDRLSISLDIDSRTRESSTVDKPSRQREPRSRQRESRSRQRELISESSRTRREVRDDDSPPSTPADPAGTADSASSDAPIESRLPAWVALVMSRRDGWTAADAVAYCEDKFARAKGGSVAASRRVKFIGTCLDNDDQAGGKAGNATLGKPPRRPVKALCIGCAAVADDIDSDETAERRELEILAWGIDPDEVMPSSWGFGYCAEHWTGLNAETRRDLVERMQGHPPCELCGRSYAIADEQAYDIRHGGRPTLRRCPHCWRVGDPWAVVEPEPASVPEADRPTPDPAPAALDAQQPARLAAGAVVAAPVPDRVAVPYSWQQAVRGGKCPSCDSPAVVLVDGCGFYCEPHSR